MAVRASAAVYTGCHAFGPGRRTATFLVRWARKHAELPVNSVHRLFNMLSRPSAKLAREACLAAKAWHPRSNLLAADERTIIFGTLLAKEPTACWCCAMLLKC